MKKWYNDLNKQKCPNCKSIDLVRVNKKFVTNEVATTTHHIHEPAICAVHRMQSHPREPLIKTETSYEKRGLYNIQIKCEDCKHTWSETEYGAVQNNK